MNLNARPVLVLTKFTLFCLGVSALVMSSLSFSLHICLAFASIFASSSAYAGDMGRADIQNRNDLPITTEYAAQCVGPMDKWEGPECIVRFHGGRITVDDSIGITKQQISGLSFHWGSDVRKYIDVVYTTSDGSVSIAQFGFRYGNVAKQFINSLVRFLGANSPSK